jgi:hypothetical protein
MTTQDGRPVVAMTGQGTTVVGVLTRADLTKMDVTYASSGFGVIVERGKSTPVGIEQTRAAIRAQRPHAETIAPRTVLFLVMCSNPCINLVIQASTCNDRKRTLVLQNVLIRSLFLSIILRTRLIKHSCLERPRRTSGTRPGQRQPLGHGRYRWRGET